MAGSTRGSRAALNDQLDRSALHDVAFHDANIRDRHSDSPVIDQLTQLIADGVHHGAWDVAEPRLTGVILFHAMHGAVDNDVIVAAQADRRRLVAGLQTLFRRAVAPK